MNDKPTDSAALPIVRSVKNMFFRRHRGCPLSVKGAPEGSLDVTYKNVDLLKRFITERGRIMPSRISGVSSKKQRALKREIKRARFLALLPYVDIK
ncbi:MAG: 30S ribosomal protein S18 [Rickettsiales bacterium]